MTVLSGARVVTTDGVLDGGWVQVEGATITAVGTDRPPESGTDLGGAWLLPGYVDLHTHGGNQGSIDESAAGLATSVAFHRAHGTTRTLASVVTGSVDHMCAVAGWIADAVEAGPSAAGHIVGVHLEGPFISTARCGAQDPEQIRDPDPAVLRRLLDAGRGTVRMITIAPERPGALDAIRTVTAEGVIAAIGHTDTYYADAVAGIEAGARVITHAFNGMRGIHHRDPGAIGAGLDHPALVAEVINDGMHLHNAAVRLLAETFAGRFALITDAMAAAGVGDGEYGLGDRRVIVKDGMAVLEGGSSIAGSTLTMERAVQRAVREVGLPIEVVAAAAATTPARVLGGEKRFGSIAAGLDADLVVLDDDLAVRRVMALGEWI